MLGYTLRSGLLIFLFFCLNASSNTVLSQHLHQNQKPLSKKLDDYLNRANAFGFSGQVLVAKNGKVLVNKGYGLANREGRRSIKRKTAFNIASLTKAFTAEAIMLLEQSQKLKTTDSIDKFFSDVPKDKAKITIHQLLTHTAGLRRDINRKLNTTRESTVGAIFKQQLASPIGEKFRYSNNGYHLLAAIIEKASRKSYSDYLRETMFKKLGMRRTGFFQDRHWSNLNIAQGYNEWAKVRPFTQWKKNWNYGSGSIVSNTKDIYKWFIRLKGSRLSERIFTRYSKTNNAKISYGYGWYVTKAKNGGPLIYHGGDNYGYHSELRWFPKSDLLLIVLTNNEAFSYIDGGAVQKRIIANNLYRIVTGQKHQSPPTVGKRVTKNLSKYVGTYVLPGGEKFLVKKHAGFLNISAEGQKAVNYLAGYDPESTIKSILRHLI